MNYIQFIGCVSILTLAACGRQSMRDNASAQLKLVKAIQPVSLATGIPAWNEAVDKHAEAVGLTNGDYTECAETVEIKGAYLCASLSLETMNRALTRASLFVEGNFGATRGTIISLNSSAFLHGLGSIGGHDLRSQDLLRFWQELKSQCTQNSAQCASPQEKEFFETFVLPLSRVKNDFVIITYAVHGRMRYTDVVTHEVMHAQYFLQPTYQKIADDFWESTVSSEDKESIKAILGQSYDTSDALLLRNEFQAYILMAGAGRSMLSGYVTKYRKGLEDKLLAGGVVPVQVDKPSANGSPSATPQQPRPTPINSSPGSAGSWSLEGCFQTFRPQMQGTVVCVQDATSEHPTVAFLDTTGHVQWCSKDGKIESNSATDTKVLRFEGDATVTMTAKSRNPLQGDITVGSVSPMQFMAIGQETTERLMTAINQSNMCN